MSSGAGAVHALLSADATLLALLTGGIYLKHGQENVLDRKETPAAYSSSTGLLNPCAVVRGRATVPMGLRDPEAQYATTRQVVEIYLYKDRSGGAATLESARDRIFALLEGQRFAIGFFGQWFNRIEDERAPELNNAHLYREDYIIISTATAASSSEPIVLLESGADLQLES